MIGRYQRRSPELDEMMVEAYVSGVSQRKMGDVTEALMGERVGRSTVSRVAKRLDEAVEGLRRAPIEGPHPYLYLDATFLDARWARKVENVSALVAYAVGPEGHRRLLAVTLGAEESQQSWSELLEQLQDRGLGGVELVIADEHAGLAAAVRRFLPEARRQRCTVHLQRNVGARVPHRLRKRVAREVSVIFQTSGLAEAKKLLGEFGARWKKELPEAVEVLERGFGAATQFYAFPRRTGPGCVPPTASSGCTARSNAGSRPPAPSRTGPAPSGSSRPSHSGPHTSGATGVTSTSHSSRNRRSPKQPSRRRGASSAFTHKSGLDRTALGGRSVGCGTCSRGSYEDRDRNLGNRPGIPGRNQAGPR